MTYGEFMKTVLAEIKSFLPAKYAEAEVRIQTVVKNNDQKLDGLSIVLPGANIAPTIYLNSFWKEYEAGKNMEDILEQIAEIRVEHEVTNDFDINEISNFERVKERITCRLVNAEQNAEYLSDKPHKLMGDLAVTYHVAIAAREDGWMTTPVTNHLLKEYGINAENLHENAKKNMETLFPLTFKGMSEVMADMMGIEQAEMMGLFPVAPEDEKLFVLTNTSKLHGAAALLSEKIMSEITEKIGPDFYILPSSVHEVLIVPKTAGMNLSDLEGMVREVNATQVAPEERLSDHVYEYDSKNHELLRADKAAERKPSLSEKLAEADEKVAMQAAVKGKTLENERG